MSTFKAGDQMNPCTRCNGSGTEPDPLAAAYDAMVREVQSVTSDIASRREAMSDYRATWETFAASRDERAFWLQTALRDILGRFADRYSMNGTHQILQCPNYDIANWRKILDSEGSA